MTAITAALREAGQVVSTADRVAWRVHAEALARLRAHPAILRADLIDAALAALVKDALDRPPAWAAGGAAPGHPALAAMLRALTGRREDASPPAPGSRPSWRTSPSACAPPTWSRGLCAATSTSTGPSRPTGRGRTCCTGWCCSGCRGSPARGRTGPSPACRGSASRSRATRTGSAP